MSDEKSFAERVDEIRERRESTDSRDKPQNPTTLKEVELSLEELHDLDVCPVCMESFEGVARTSKLGRLNGGGICIHGETIFFHSEQTIPTSRQWEDGPRGTAVDVNFHGPPQYLSMKLSEAERIPYGDDG